VDLRLRDSQEILARSTVVEAGRLRYTSESGFVVELITDPSQVEIANPLFDGLFHPFPSELVHRALEEMEPLGGERLAVTVHLLPGLPAGIGSSFATGGEIFLAPAVAPWAPETAAYTLVHELGHAVQHLQLPDRAGPGWSRYLQLRGLTDTEVHHVDAVHRDRPGEIFAEDFRALFGGPLATASGSIENPDLPLPREVAGLSEFFLEVLAGRWRPRPALIAVGNHPNPFNPATVIRVRLDEGVAPQLGPVRLSVHDAQGRRVRDLGSFAPRAILEVRWDGRDARGRTVASGRYLCRVEAGGQVLSAPMILLK
jgi:hypothetical protein